jgi:hypothetical protein
MIENIETLNYQQLSTEEKQEYLDKLIDNGQKLCLQLVNSGDIELAEVIATAILMAMHDPNRLYAIHSYTANEFQQFVIQNILSQKTAETVKQEAEEPEPFPPLVSEKLH